MGIAICYHCMETFRSVEKKAWHIIYKHGMHNLDYHHEEKKLKELHEKLQKEAKKNSPIVIMKRDIKRKQHEREDMDTLMYYLDKQEK